MSDDDKTVDNKLLYCSFCGKSQQDVKKLIAGPSVFVCDECVELCNDIIREELLDHGTVLRGAYLQVQRHAPLPSRHGCKSTPAHSAGRGQE